VEGDGPELYKGQGKVLLLSSQGRVAGVDGFDVALGSPLGQQYQGWRRICKGG
jgi:methyl-accepting chemotaxis protein